MGLKTAPYGTWSSPISAKAITTGVIVLSDVIVDPKTSKVYHLESRPSEGGRNVLVDTETGRDVVGQGWNVATGVQEFGGAPAIAFDGVVYFTDYARRRVYRVKDGGEPEPITPENPVHRFANFDAHPTLPLLVAILEDHTIDAPEDIITTLCIINTTTKTVEPFISGSDFYSSPKFSPDGTRITWQQWSHPDMPWQGGRVHVADVVVDAQGHGLSIKNDTHIAGVADKISCCYPSWANNDTIIFTSDESGYWNPWKYTNGKASAIFSKPVAEEFGGPNWFFNYCPYAVIDVEGKHAVFTATPDGRSVLYLVDIDGTSAPKLIESPYVVIQNVRCVSREKHEFVFIAEQADVESSVTKGAVSLTDASTKFTVLKSSTSAAQFSPEIISRPNPMWLETRSDLPVHIIYYAPVNPDYAGSSIEGEKPPCVLNVHGGPTSYTTQALNWQKQFFTSRGWGWLDVNYGGSAGYGRAYVDRIAGKWGIVDAEDCISAARALSSAPHNLIDPKRIIIRGGSAGGFTTLGALSTASDLRVFAAGTSLYGISDLRKLSEATHKFQFHYIDKLLGGTYDEVPEAYKARSAIFHAHKIVSPLLMQQGDIDKVVPKEQSDDIYNIIKKRGGVVQYKVYSGEGHGWRQEQNIRDSLEMELKFYQDVLKL